MTTTEEMESGDPSGAASDPAPTSAAGLASTILAEEARRAEEQEGRTEVVLPDDLLPGVGGETMSLRPPSARADRRRSSPSGSPACSIGFDVTALSVLAPDIQDTLGASDAVMGAIAGAGGVLFLLGSVPISTPGRPPSPDADRRRVAWRSGRSSSFVHRPGPERLLALHGPAGHRPGPVLRAAGERAGARRRLPDRGPRRRVFAAYVSFQLGRAGSSPRCWPAGITGLVGGPESWRWVFFVVRRARRPRRGHCARLPQEPRRGRNEMQAVLGEELDEDGASCRSRSASPSSGCARSGRSTSSCSAWPASASPCSASRSSSTSSSRTSSASTRLERGLFGSLVATPGHRSRWPSPARRADRLFRRSPPGRGDASWAAWSRGFGVLRRRRPAACRTWCWSGSSSPSASPSRRPRSPLSRRPSSVIPYRLRSRGAAMVGVYLFCFGGFFGAVLTGVLSDAIGRQAAVIAVILPSSLIGGGAHGLRRPLHPGGHLPVRRGAPGGAGGAGPPPAATRASRRPSRSATSTSPTAPCRCSSTSHLDVHRGRDRGPPRARTAPASRRCCGSSAGSGVPSRGVVRLDGRTVTYADPEVRVKIGIVQLMGGKATFPSLTVGENLRMAGYLYRGADLERRIDAALGRFPALAERRKRRGRRPVGRPAADARPGHGARARARGAGHRRAVARPGPDRGAGAPRAPCGASRSRARR